MVRKIYKTVFFPQVKKINTSHRLIYIDQQLEMTGQRANGKLYYLYIVVKIQGSCLNATSCPLSISIWQHRLGRVIFNNKKILKMSKNNVPMDSKQKKAVKLQHCATAAFQGRCIRHPFQKEERPNDCVGDLIHSDVSGPMDTTQPCKSPYYVLFKDDFSGWCEVHFMQNNSEVLLFSKFYRSL